MDKHLTEREYDVLVCMHAGMTGKEIAGALGISHTLYDKARASLFMKLDVKRAIQAALMYERGTFPPIRRVADIAQPRPSGLAPTTSLNRAATPAARLPAPQGAGTPGVSNPLPGDAGENFTTSTHEASR